MTKIERFVGSGMKTLIISNKEMNHIMKIVKSLEESDLLTKDTMIQLEMMQRKKKMYFLVYC